MKAVMLDVPRELLDERRRKGLDARDEAWEGVLHMVPPPSWDHQETALDLGALLRSYCRKHGLGVVGAAVGVRTPRSGTTDFRVPDIVFLAEEHGGKLSADRQWIEGGPDVVIEIRSPGDETYDKLPFYASVGVSEVVVIARDARRVEVFALAGDRYEPREPDPDGWIAARGLRVKLRASPGGSGRLDIFLELDGASATV